MEKVNILGIDINSLSLKELLNNLETGIVFTPNVDHLVRLQNDRDFFEAYSIADYKLCDSKILIYASRFLSTPIEEKISGSDFLPAFYMYHKENSEVRIFLLGGREGVAKKAQAAINKKLKREIIVAAYSPSFGFERDEKECLDIIRRVNKSQATVLVVGVGSPKQEKWVYKYREKLPGIKLIFSLGATIDFEAGNLKRAPKWMSDSGLEWLYRLMSEPGRLWKRYLVNDLPFFLLILKQKLGYISKNSLSVKHGYTMCRSSTKNAVFANVSSNNESVIIASSSRIKT